MKFEIKKATKRAARLRMALIGLSGGGKTYKSLLIARELAGPEGRVIVIDTERGSASKYADVTSFDVIELESFAPRTYVEAIRACEDAGADVIVIDSLSHAWIGKEGALDQVDRFAKRQSGNTFGAWREVTPQHNELVDAILRARAHVVVTIRAKMDYSQEKDERTGRTVVRKVGLAAVQRDGLEYEFDVVADVDFEHNAVISKTRCSALADKVFPMRDTETLARELRTWLSDGAAPATAQRFAPPRPREPGEDDDAPVNDGPAPIVTTKGITLASAAAVREHVVEGVKTRKHLEATARKYGSHPWARPALIEVAIGILEADRDDVSATIDHWAKEGPKPAPAERAA